MVNEEKVRIMTQIALDETKNCKEEIGESGYYRSDYVRIHTLKVMWTYTISYFLVLILIGLYRLEYLFVNIVRLDYRSLGAVVLGFYVGMMMVCIVLSTLHYSAKYKKNRKKLKTYFSKLRLLEDYYARSREGGNG